MIKKLVICLLLSVGLSINVHSSGAILQWDPVCNTNVLQYNFYFTTNKFTVPQTNVFSAYVDDCGVNRPVSTNVYFGSYSPTNFIALAGRTNTTLSLTNLTKGVTYYFYVTCRSLFFESEKSSEVSFQIPMYSVNSVPSKVNGIKVLLIQ